MTEDAGSFEKRVAESSRILQKYPDRVPVFVDKAKHSNLPDIEKRKFLVPGTMLVGEFKYIVHKQVTQGGGEGIAADQTIYLFLGNTSPKTGAAMSEVYEQYKDSDGFLYLTYSAENTLGRDEGTILSTR